MEKNKFQIDFVIFWVDGNDLNWQQKMCQYKGVAYQQSKARYRNWDFLHFWFRAVEKFAPWVNHIYFVSDQQCPSFLNMAHPKLTIVDHTHFIPAKFLPTFQANTIEDNIHRISNLSEHFVVFNDDMFLNAPISPSYYFSKEGLPMDCPMERAFAGRGYDAIDKWGINIMEYCDVQVLNLHFNRKEVIAKNPKGWKGFYMGWKNWINTFLLNLFKRTEFQHFYSPHNEKAFLKSVCEEVWEKEPELLANSCTKFRENVSVNNYLMRYWQLASNKFSPSNNFKNKRVVQLEKGSEELLQDLLFDDRICSLCLNDSSKLTDKDFQWMKSKVLELLEKKFPHKSSFEL